MIRAKNNSLVIIAVTVILWIMSFIIYDTQSKAITNCTIKADVTNVENSVNHNKKSGKRYSVKYTYVCNGIVYDYKVIKNIKGKVSDVIWINPANPDEATNNKSMLLAYVLIGISISITILSIIAGIRKVLFKI